MPPEGRGGKFQRTKVGVSGFPQAWRAWIVEEAGRRSVGLSGRKRVASRDLYIEAIEHLLSRLRRGENVKYIATSKSGGIIQFWIDDDLLAEIDRFITDRVNRTVFIMTALVEHFPQLENING